MTKQQVIEHLCQTVALAHNVAGLTGGRECFCAEIPGLQHYSRKPFDYVRQAVEEKLSRENPIREDDTLPKADFESDLTRLLNRYSKENESDTPDFMLASFILRSLHAWRATILERDKWYGFKTLTRDHRREQGPETSPTMPAPPESVPSATELNTDYRNVGICGGSLPTTATAIGGGPLPTKARATGRCFSSPFDWNEDLVGEEGLYECRCLECHRTFFGHKRRALCKVCFTQKEKAHERDWLEDLCEKTPVGSCTCAICKRPFLGNKSRSFCRKCVTLTPAPRQSQGSAAHQAKCHQCGELQETFLWVGNQTWCQECWNKSPVTAVHSEEKLSK